MRTVAVIVGDFGALWEALPIVAYCAGRSFLFVDRRTPMEERRRYLDDLLQPGDSMETFYADSGLIAIPNSA